MESTIGVVINVSSGAASTEQKLNQLKSAFSNCSVDPEYFLIHKGLSAGEITKKAVAKGHGLIVACGGDGTINAVASELLDTGVALGVLPFGTFNHLAQDLNIPQELDDAVRVLVEGKSVLIDAGEVNGLLFLNNSSIGLYSKLVHYRDEHQKEGWSKRWALIKAILTSVGKYSFLNVEMDIDGSHSLVKTPLVFIGNNFYEIEGLNIGSRNNLDDGLFCVYIIKHSGRMHLASLVVRALFGKLRGHEKFDEFTTDAVTLTTRKRFLKVALDGEIVTLESPLRYSMKKRALKVIVP